MSYIDDLNQAASEALAASSSATDSAQIMFDVANGGETTTVTTANGEVKSLAKAIKDIIDSIEAGVEAPQVEPQTLAAGQTTVTLATMTTEGIAVYVEGSREFDFTVVSSTDFDFGQSFPDGTRIWVVKRDIEGVADSFTVNTSTGSQTLSNALDQRVIYVDTIADLQALPTSGLVDGQAASVQGSEFRWSGAGWEARNTPSAASFGLEGITSAASWQSAVDDCITFGAKSFRIPFDVASLDGAVDCKGLHLLCEDTTLPASTKTFVNHSGVERGSIAGVKTSAQQINLADRPSFEKSKFIRWDSGRNFTVFLAKKNPAEGMLEILSEENISSSTNSIGGSSATRITSVRNVNDLIGHKHTYASASHTPADTVTRSVGSGTGGADAAFWNIPAGDNIVFSPGHVIDEVSILFLLSGGSSPSMQIEHDGKVVDTISLVQPTGGEDMFIYRHKVTPGSGNITITNTTAGTETGYVAGVNSYRPGEDIKPGIDVDTFSYTYNSNDYTNSKGAVDYAMRRHSDAYAGDDPTGGSYHGGETIVAQSVRLDGGADWTSSAAAGDIAAAKRIEFVSNVDVVWPSDLAEVNVVRLNQIGDGAIFKDVRVTAGDMVFDAVWLTMWTTPAGMVARGLTAREVSGVSSEMLCYDRGNEIRQDSPLSFGVRNSWTLFDNERNSNGGPYIASESGTRAKLYYGPILFNKGAVGTVHSQQVTEFFGKN